MMGYKYDIHFSINYTVLFAILALSRSKWTENIRTALSYPCRSEGLKDTGDNPNIGSNCNRQNPGR